MSDAELLKLSDAELDRWAAELMEKEPPLYYVQDCGLLPGTWHCKCADDGEIIIRQHATGSLDSAAQVEAKVIEKVGRGVLWDKLWDVVVACSESIGTTEATQRCAFATARQRTIAALACLDDHIPDAGKKANSRGMLGSSKKENASCND